VEIILQNHGEQKSTLIILSKTNLERIIFSIYNKMEKTNFDTQIEFDNDKCHEPCEEINNVFDGDNRDKSQKQGKKTLSAKIFIVKNVNIILKKIVIMLNI